MMMLTRDDHLLADAWRGTLASLRDHLDMIPMHEKTLANKDVRLTSGQLLHSPDYVHYSAACLRHRYAGYLRDLRRVVEYEAEMVERGIPFNRREDYR